MERSDLFPLISNTWCQWIFGSPVHIWEKKIKLTKEALKPWAKTFSRPQHLNVMEKKKKAGRNPRGN
jgi:hypothetical protein